MINNFLKTVRERAKVRRKGFTLIEVILVVVVLGLLGAAIVPRYNTYLENSRYSRAESDLDTIMTAVAATYSQEGSFGTVTAGPMADAFSGDFAETFETMFGRPIEDLTDPWGNDYRIVTESFNEANAAGTLKVRCVAGSGTDARTNPNNKDREMERILFSF